jgi:hypothetical protein
VKGVWNKDAAVLLDRCERFTVTDCSILDCDGIGLLLRDCAKTSIRGCVIRDDREPAKASLSFKVEGGSDLWARDNWLTNGIDPQTPELLNANRVK